MHDTRQLYVVLDIDGTLIPLYADEERTRAHNEDDVVHFASHNMAAVDRLISSLTAVREAGGRVILNSGRRHEFCEIVSEMICGDQVDVIMSELGCGLSRREGRSFTAPELSSAVRPNIVSAMNDLRSQIEDEVKRLYGVVAHKKRYMYSFSYSPKLSRDPFVTNVRRVIYDTLPEITGLVEFVDAGAALDVVPIGIDKGRAILNYLRSERIKRDDVRLICVGDSHGDLPMFKIADVVVVMQGAPQLLRDNILERSNFMLCTGGAPNLTGAAHELERLVR